MVIAGDGLNMRVKFWNVYVVQFLYEIESYSMN